jgi:hypothetical protein
MGESLQDGESSAARRRSGRRRVWLLLSIGYLALGFLGYLLARDNDVWWYWILPVGWTSLGVGWLVKWYRAGPPAADRGNAGDD